jgi:methylenetetrahydrofolate--tRNA-(uracil-5-)-methyltransferase
VIPGLEKAEFLRYGSIHRNTFINSPRHLNQDLSLKDRDSLYIAGQITGVEGYIESTAMGLLAGINAARRLSGREAVSPSSISAHGALLRHITESEPMYFQPSNIHFGLIPCEDDEQRIQDKKMRRTRIAELALKAWSRYVSIIRLKEIEEQLYGR